MYLNAKTKQSAMLQPLTDFLELFQHKYFESRPNFRYDDACVGQSFKWATVQFRAKTGAKFPHVAAATQLTSHNKWWSVLKPLVMLQRASSVEQEEGGEEEEGALVVSGLQSTIASKRTRREKEDGGDDEKDSRRMRQRVEPREVELPMSPFRPQSPGIVSPLPWKATHSNLDEVKLRKVVAMERRLDLDTMTQGEDGLSPEAQEYLRWQRQQILRKMREEMNDVATT
ncbi:hypothetical protein PHYSODRAFT_260611 [Phytophthora sojae]|uniref:Uncharacterized protein n=1 Tax=Phytophthora sojae (strain P6497) TaxID=1094619 RepID=G5A305_PHYSP|nr:hypothetical protein PHYSODRAFT_260611 [Phytophthora sojae]EGZ10045.1 hypothetical protein PHYSODRAFT_260611 [Phytophthora sojae]|eukprot:XP_009534906.1 hypothetical protein PHYSODRAFT_260611 [Phytophthora sojae]